MFLNYFGYDKQNVKMEFQKSEREMPKFDYLSSQIEDDLLHMSFLKTKLHAASF